LGQLFELSKRKKRSSRRALIIARQEEVLAKQGSDALAITTLAHC
jgi:hypothetical protein